MDVMPDTAGYVHGKRTDQIQIHRGNEDLPGHERLSIDRPHADPGVRLYRVRMISLIPSISKSPRSRSDLTESHVRVAGGGITCHPFIELSLDQNENRSKSPQKSNNHSDVTDAEQTPRLTSVVADNIGLAPVEGIDRSLAFITNRWNGRRQCPNRASNSRTRIHPPAASTRFGS